VDILRADIVRTLKLLGCASIADLNRTYIEAPADWLTHTTVAAPGNWAR
jgi:L-lactate dehydrogenase (cytochrome)